MEKFSENSRNSPLDVALLSFSPPITCPGSEFVFYLWPLGGTKLKSTLWSPSFIFLFIGSIRIKTKMVGFKLYSCKMPIFRKINFRKINFRSRPNVKNILVIFENVVHRLIWGICDLLWFFVEFFYSKHENWSSELQRVACSSDQTVLKIFENDKIFSPIRSFLSKNCYFFRLKFGTNHYSFGILNSCVPNSQS